MSRAACPVILDVQREFLNPDVATLRPEAVLFPGMGALIVASDLKVFGDLQDHSRSAFVILYQQVAYFNVALCHHFILQF
jgi:hypothetical protein